LGGTAARLVYNIIEYVKTQEFADKKDAQQHLSSLLDGAFGIEKREIKLYRASQGEDDCPNGGDIANDCAFCAYSAEHHFKDGECIIRKSEGD
jgi:biotin synthase-like enzyme